MEYEELLEWMVCRGIFKYENIGARNVKKIADINIKNMDITLEEFNNDVAKYNKKFNNKMDQYFNNKREKLINKEVVCDVFGLHIVEE